MMRFACRLSVQELEVRRGARTLLKGLSLDAQPGQLVIIRGANGSGKTSLIRTLAGLSEPAAGQILWRDDQQEIDDYQEQLAYVAHHPAVHPSFTALENLHLGLSLHQQQASAEWIVTLFKQLGLNPRLMAAKLSQGQQRRLALAQLTLLERPVWLLDEPLTALDESAVTWFRTALARHLAAGGLCLMSLHQEFDWPAEQLQTLQLTANRNAAISDAMAQVSGSSS